MLVAVGTDLVDVLRLEAHLAQVPALAERLFTARERELCAGCAESLAARLAAKEAVLKALGSALAPAPATAATGASSAAANASASCREAGDAAPTESTSWRLTDIEVTTAPGTAPLLALHGPAARVAAGLGVRRWHLSLAHDGGVALAYVVADG